MTVPTFDQLIHPLLKVLSDHPDGIRTKDAYEAVAALIELPDEDRRVFLPSGKQPVYVNRIGWAQDRLKRAGLSHSISRGTWQLSEAGRTFVLEHKDGIDADTLQQLARPPMTVTAPDGSVTMPAPTEDLAGAQSPDERIDAAVAELNESLSAELLEVICKSDPIFFETLVLDVLHAMGYGKSRSDLQQTVASGDAGIDGIITLDRLGLEKVYVQAKRWNTSSVGRPEIQKFVGALAGHGGSRGVFITTSTFSADARKYVDQVPSSLVLIDGQQLASLMIEYGVGVSVQRTVKIARLDSDYFEES
jgi:restriction system protein